MKYTFNQILFEVANGKRVVTIQFPDTKPFKGIITDINLSNPAWKPIKVNIITKGLTITDFRWVDHPMMDEEVKEEYQRPYTEDWIKVEFITSIDFEPNKQITLTL